jgi:hypothetical protein
VADDQTNLVDMPLMPCEFCEKRVHEDDLVQHGDCSLCPKCSAEWMAEYDACDHEWEQEQTDDYRVCKKCNGSDHRQLGDDEEDDGEDAPSPPTNSIN